jgi:hypothetical protein
MQITLNLDHLLEFLRKVYVWTPQSNTYIRTEIMNFINELKKHKQQ